MCHGLHVWTWQMNEKLVCSFICGAPGAYFRLANVLVNLTVALWKTSTFAMQNCGGKTEGPTGSYLKIWYIIHLLYIKYLMYVRWSYTLRAMLCLIAGSTVAAWCQWLFQPQPVSQKVLGRHTLIVLNWRNKKGLKMNHLFFSTMVWRISWPSDSIFKEF